MFAAIQNDKIIYCYENELLCEAFARGFQSVDELRLWESELPRDDFGVPIRPEAPFEIRRLEGALLEEYLQLAREGYRPGEIRLRSSDAAESEGNSSPAAESVNGEIHNAISANENQSEDEAEFPIAAAVVRTQRFAPDTAALARRQQRVAWDAVREERNALLDKSDKYMMPDYPIDDTRRAQWRDYRAQLRDVTNDFASPEAVEWPPPPE